MIDLNKLWNDTPSQLRTSVKDLLPKGKYVGVILEAVHGYTKTTQNDCIKYTFKIKGGDHNGRNVFETKVITEKTIPWVKSELKNLNIEINRLDDLAIALEGLLGKEVDLYVTVSPARGDFSESNRVNINGFHVEHTPDMFSGGESEDDLPF